MSSVDEADPRPGCCCSGSASARTRTTALERAPLILTHTAPDPSILAGLQRPREAVLDHRTAPAHGLGLLNLQQSRPRVADWEEQLGVLVTAERAMAPVHAGPTP